MLNPRLEVADWEFTRSGGLPLPGGGPKVVYIFNVLQLSFPPPHPPPPSAWENPSPGWTPEGHRDPGALLLQAGAPGGVQLLRLSSLELSQQLSRD
jgi:hypothetical protein